MKIQIEVAPFPVPDSVTILRPPGKRQDGFKQNDVIPLGELSRDELDGLIAEFAQSVYSKAGVTQEE
jgi:hypothetical protein